MDAIEHAESRIRDAPRFVPVALGPYDDTAVSMSTMTARRLCLLREMMNTLCDEWGALAPISRLKPSPAVLFSLHISILHPYAIHTIVVQV